MWITNILNSTQTVQSIRIRLKSWTTLGDGSSLVLNISQGYITSNPKVKKKAFFWFVCLFLVAILIWGFLFVFSWGFCWGVCLFCFEVFGCLFLVLVFWGLFVTQR